MRVSSWRGRTTARTVSLDRIAERNRSAESTRAAPGTRTTASVASGTPTGNPTGNQCTQQQCNGNGGTVTVNPASGNGATGKRWPDLRRRAAELGLSGDEVLSEYPGHLAEAARGVGMHGFPFTEYARFAEDLRSVGVEA